MKLFDVVSVSPISIDMQWIPRTSTFLLAISASLWIATTTRLTTRSLLWTIFGVTRPVMDFYDTTTPSYHSLIPGTISRCNQASTPLHKLKIGSATTTWLYPHVCLTYKFVSHMKVCNAAGTLVVPLWKLAPFWWPFIYKQMCGALPSFSYYYVH